MNNNDILRRIRYVFDYSDTKMIQIFALTDTKITRAELCEWLKKEGEDDYKECKDVAFAAFLNGLIIENRGKRDGPAPVAEVKLSNNMILTKLKIALNLKAEDILALLALAGIKVGKSELSAFFRKPNHKNYRRCLDQFLRNFLDGMTLKYREGAELSKSFEWTQLSPKTSSTDNNEQ